MSAWFAALPSVEDVIGPIPAALWLVLWALATTRVAGLVALDSIFDRPRLAVGNAAARRRSTAWVEILITCMWCVGVWTAAGLIVAAMLTHTAGGERVVFEWAVVGLAIAQVTGMLSGIGRE